MDAARPFGFLQKKSTLIRMYPVSANGSAGIRYCDGHSGRDESPPNCWPRLSSFALFPGLTVLENVEAPARVRGLPPTPPPVAPCEHDAVGLDGFEERLPQGTFRCMNAACGVAQSNRRRARSSIHDEAVTALDVSQRERKPSAATPRALARSKIPKRATNR